MSKRKLEEFPIDYSFKKHRVEPLSLKRKYEYDVGDANGIVKRQCFERDCKRTAENTLLDKRVCKRARMIDPQQYINQLERVVDHLLAENKHQRCELEQLRMLVHRNETSLSLNGVHAY